MVVRRHRLRYHVDKVVVTTVERTGGGGFEEVNGKLDILEVGFVDCAGCLTVGGDDAARVDFMKPKLIDVGTRSP